MAINLTFEQPTDLTWWPSPAKLNLFLHITGRDQRGYHLLQSLFQILDFGDQLAFEVTPSGQIEMCTDLDSVPAQDNLIVRAATLLQQHTQCPLGAKIWLHKVLPMGGGIGGGSSNAATALLVLNHLWKTNLSLQQLAELGLQLGADVPIFVHGKTAFAEGVGEKITPVNLASQIYLVAFPNCHVSTAEVFSAPDLVRDSAKIAWQDYIFSETRNDCQKLVCERYPKVANLLHDLLEYAPSRMTGTGACLFSVFDNMEEAEKVKNKLPNDCQAFITKGVNESPLHAALAKSEASLKLHDN
ncbi:4-(cytidine 5'-diphospho)-2-C-methyl-D-erythritol kinase [Aliiglaciecola litoralis]|uniref:4-diphosphocytidyl-2-C-methyl-D-erythritol kinase n=1 Tax=Aliiglaciecola litoralis TaxID=582857 RepID=A0ABP3WZD8_9ALTE